MVTKDEKDMKLTDVVPQEKEKLEESYMPNLEVQMPVLTLKKGVAALLKELTGTTVKELQITPQIYLLYTGKLPSKNEIASLIQSRYGVSYEKALAMIKIK